MSGAIVTFSRVYSGIFNRFIHMDIHRVRGWVFVLALLLYGAFGSPTPDNPGFLEFLIAALLILAVGVSGVLKSLTFKERQEGWRFPAQMFFVFGLSVPLVGGVIGGNAPGLLIRDVIPFLFMCLPLFMTGHSRFLLYGVLAVGVLFGLRSGFEMAYLGGGDKLFYLANMPSVLFAAVFFAGMVLGGFAGRFDLRLVLRGLAFMALAGICLYPALETQQRASAGIFVLSMVGIFGFYLWKKPSRMLVVLSVVGCGIILFFPELRDVFYVLGRKTELVGVNMRYEEWRAVWAEISVHPFSLLFGKGWGATFSSPAVADIEVNFTHGLLSSLLLKTGLTGTGLGLLYLGALGRGLFHSRKAYPVLVFALAGPILIDVFLYASFKSLDFGLMLLLVTSISFYGDGNSRCVESGEAVLYSDKGSSSLYV